MGASAMPAEETMRGKHRPSPAGIPVHIQKQVCVLSNTYLSPAKHMVAAHQEDAGKYDDNDVVGDQHPDHHPNPDKKQDQPQELPHIFTVPPILLLLVYAEISPANTVIFYSSESISSAPKISSSSEELFPGAKRFTKSGTISRTLVRPS